MQESLCPLLDEYLRLVDNTEPPLLYHRWCMISNIAALLHRRTKIDISIGDIFPNLYIILLGSPATRKSTAINISGKLLAKAGHTRIAGGKTGPEKFLTDLYTGFDTIGSGFDSPDLIDLDLSNSNVSPASQGKISDVIVNAGELQSFFGVNNLTFITLLTDLFDNPPHHDDRTKTGVSNRIINPTISIMGGATTASFKRMFPIEIIGQGLLSRFLLIHGDGPRKKLFIPKEFDTQLEKDIVEHLSHIRVSPEVPTVLKFSDDAYDYSKVLYESPKDEISDSRFQYYNGRRNVHYMKLCVIVAICNLNSRIELDDCIFANTLLSYTEKFMPKALGEFGLDQSAETTDVIFSKISNSATGLTLAELFKQTLSSVGNVAELSSHVLRLVAANRIEKLTNNEGIIRFITIQRTVNSESNMVDYSILKEYQENPTFDTSYKSNPQSELEYELSLVKAKSEATSAFEIIPDVTDTGDAG